MYINKEIYEKYPSIVKAFKDKPIRRLIPNDDHGGYVLAQSNHEQEQECFSGGFYEMHCKEQWNLHE